MGTGDLLGKPNKLRGSPKLFHTILFFSIIERSVLMALVFHYKDMLEKVAMQRAQQFFASLCNRKNSVKCSAFAIARKIDTECFCRNFPISNDPVHSCPIHSKCVESSLPIEKPVSRTC